jgi:hypothetical protein
MAGHLFGYRTALAIDQLALPLRRMRGAIEETFALGTAGRDIFGELRPHLQPHWLEFRKDLLLGRYDGTLEARTAARLVTLCNYALGFVPLDVFAVEFGEPGTPGVVVDRLTEELTHGIDQLTRPVDAIKHQAKTVTVGISRADEAVLTVPLVKALLAAGAHRDHIGYRDLRALAGPRPGGARSARQHPLPHRRRPRRRHGPGPRHRPARHRHDAAFAHLEQPGAARHQAPRRDGEAVPRRQAAAATTARSCWCPRSTRTAPVGITLLHVRFARATSTPRHCAAVLGPATATATRP